MRRLDVTDDGGRSLPVLGRRDNGAIATAALAAVLVAEVGLAPGEELDDDQWLQLHRIACGDAEEAAELASELIEACALESVAANFVRDLASNFLLCVLLPIEAANVRQVVKFSYQWDGAKLAVSDQDVRKRMELIQVGLGFLSFPVQIDMGSPSSAASYHLEVPAPDGVVSTSLSMPPGEAGQPDDQEVTPFGHAYDTYLDEPPAGAEAQLEVSSHGLHPAVTIASAGTFLLFLSALTLPGALTTLGSSAGGANGLLLFGPALLLAVVGGRRESSVVSRLLLPLRAVALLLSGSLFVAGASLVGKLHHPQITLLWTTFAILSGVAAIVLTAATVRLRRRGG